MAGGEADPGGRGALPLHTGHQPAARLAPARPHHPLRSAVQTKITKQSGVPHQAGKSKVKNSSSLIISILYMYVERRDIKDIRNIAAVRQLGAGLSSSLTSGPGLSLSARFYWRRSS